MSVSYFINYGVLLIYVFALLHIAIYCYLEIFLLYCYWFKPSKTAKNTAFSAANTAFQPTITVQLPVYNEPFVIVQLLESVVALDYPQHLLEIQVLDDSNDLTTGATSALIAKKIAFYQEKGIEITCIHRENRKGFKAGALANGLQTAKGEFICVFDADFTPKPDFLRKTISHFYQNNRLALVQTRWQHRNQQQSFLTRLQAMQLNVHFTVEQGGRNNANFFTQFNGTAGVWRRAAIEDAGGWHADTLTEDLDLSYRAQLAGWQVFYDETVGAPAELPNLMRDLEAQQFRWTKGGAQCARKLLPIILKSKQPFWRKMHACLHLFSSSIFASMFVMLVANIFLSILQIDAKSNINNPANEVLLDSDWLIWFVSSSFCLIIVHFFANVWIDENGKKGFGFQRFRQFFSTYPLLLAVSMGMAWRNTIAVFEGWLGRQSPFVRTPKQGNFSNQKTPKTSPILNHKTEAFFAFFLLLLGCKELSVDFFTISFFHLLWAIGFAIVAAMD